jgi:ketosteroid isomerase-like protein
MDARAGGNGGTASPSTAATKTAAGSTHAAADAAAWVAMFAEGWANPVDADSFCDHFDPWFDPEVRMIQPSLHPTVGRSAFREQFARPLFELVPDLHGTVEGWAASGDSVYIELRLEGTVGRRPFTMSTCDRIKLREGKAVERVAYLDPAPLLKAVAASPRAWPGFIRSQVRNFRRPA